MRAARTALRDLHGVEPAGIVGDGWIPLVRELHRWSPDAEFVLWGAEDLRANAHGANESVDSAEIRKGRRVPGATD